MSSISLIQPDRDLFSWPQYWACLLYTSDAADEL
ncbi:hypothetical protein ACX3VG_01050, partial [Escherichia coli]